MLGGSLLAAFAVLLMGPSPILPITKSIPSMLSAYALMGFALSPIFIPSFQHCIDSAKLAQWPYILNRFFVGKGDSTNLEQARVVSFLALYKARFPLGFFHFIERNFHSNFQRLHRCHSRRCFGQPNPISQYHHSHCLPSFDLGVFGGLNLAKRYWSNRHKFYIILEFSLLFGQFYMTKYSIYLFFHISVLSTICFFPA
jgi:hypothetical protein